MKLENVSSSKCLHTVTLKRVDCKAPEHEWPYLCCPVPPPLPLLQHRIGPEFCWIKSWVGLRAAVGNTVLVTQVL
jgi:hypothetical protein